MMKIIHKIKCLFRRHGYIETRKISPGIHELKCIHCGKEFAMNSYVKAVLPLDEELRNLHEFILTGDMKYLG